MVRVHARGFSSGFSYIRARRHMAALLLLAGSLCLPAEWAMATGPDQYVVQPGDTLSAIAERHDTTVEALAALNKIDNPSFIRAGQTIALDENGLGSAQAEGGEPPAASPVPRSPRLKFPPIKGVYMSFYSIGSQTFRDHIFEMIENTELNAVVIDVKGDRGYIAFPSQIPLAAEIGAQDFITMKDIDDLMAYFKSKDIYTIARIVTFKDNPLAQARPDLAVHSGRTGGLWIDDEGLAWVDPFQEEVWDYNIAIAREAAEKGFDEVQFDYIRFPTDGDINSAVFSQSATQETREAAIGGLLSKMKKELNPLGVKIAVDTFGYTTWRDDDMGIGQKLEDLASLVDVISPMVYPSTFGSGIPGYAYAVAYPYEIVYYSLDKALDRVASTGVEVRPWLQDFPDYAFDRRPYGAAEVLAQQKATYDAGASGWMLWDPRVRYTREALAPQ